MNLPPAVLGALDDARAFGYCELADGTQLFGHVPHVAREAWLHAVFPGLQTDQLKRLERKLRRPLPEEVEQFLRVANGLSLFSGALSLYGLRRDYTRNTESAWQPFDLEVPNVDERPHDAEVTHFFVGGYRADGSRLFVDPTDGMVYRRQRENARILNRWRGMADLLESEVVRLGWHFDSSGRRIDKAVPTTPPAET